MEENLLYTSGVVMDKAVVVYIVIYFLLLYVGIYVYDNYRETICGNILNEQVTRSTRVEQICAIGEVGER